MDSTHPNAAEVQFALERLDVTSLRPLWTDLEQRADITFYLSWLWIGPWLEEAGPPDHVLVGRAGGEVVCLGLLRSSVQRRHRFIKSRTLSLHETGDPDKDVVFIEYNGFLTDRRFGNLAPRAIAFLREAVRFDELQLGGFVDADYQAVRASACKTYVHALKTTAFVDLRAIREAGTDYLSTISSNTRYQIRRALKIYESRGPLSLQPARTAEEAIQFFEELGILHEGAWQARGAGGAWRFPFLVAFHKRVIEAAFPSGGIEIVRISCGEKPIGYIHCLVRGGWIGSYLSGFAYEEDNKVKPGLVSFYLYIQQKLNNDAETLDFLAGDHRYKTSLGQPGPSMYWFRVQERRPQLMIEDGLRSLKQRIKKRRNRAAGSGSD